jgi:predicted nucleic acid-binding protein
VVIVDTTVWVDYFKGLPTPEAEWLDRELTRQRLGLTDLILCEVLQGVASDVQADEVLRDLRQYEVFETGGVDVAAAAARHYRFLRARGTTVRKMIDCLIATFCILGDHALLHHDRDFDPFERELGLKVVHPEIKPTSESPHQEPLDQEAPDEQ